jgi:DNA-directed RNA polymerase subunit RPC12/RpoP
VIYKCNGCNDEWNSAVYVCPRCGSYAIVKLEAPKKDIKYIPELKKWVKEVSKYIKPKEKEDPKDWGMF